MQRGYLIVIEGIDGAGTTTQAARLVDALRTTGRGAHLTREPSDGQIGRMLRDMLAGRLPAVENAAMALLFAADRADHLHREIEPAIARGAIVVTDRYYHSSLAYQGSNEDREWILAINGRARRPDLTIVLEVSPEVAAARRDADQRPEELYDRIETQRRVAEGYRALTTAVGTRERLVTLDGARSMNELAAEILRLAWETCAG